MTASGTLGNWLRTVRSASARSVTKNAVRYRPILPIRIAARNVRFGSQAVPRAISIEGGRTVCLRIKKLHGLRKTCPAVGRLAPKVHSCITHFAGL